MSADKPVLSWEAAARCTIILDAPPEQWAGRIGRALQELIDERDEARHVARVLAAYVELNSKILRLASTNEVRELLWAGTVALAYPRVDKDTKS